MISGASGGNKVLVRVLPAEVEHLHDEEVVIVNRARLNSRLACLELQNSDRGNQENIKIIRRAIGSIMVQEKEQKHLIPGAKMAVKDIKRVFPDMEKMPKNSFAKVVV